MGTTPTLDDTFDIDLLNRFIGIAERLNSIPAVEYDGDVWTYQDLLNRAGSFTEFLKTMEAPRDAPVGISLGPGVDRIAVLLGSLLSGRPYVPLDYTQPAARLKTLKDIAAPAHVVTNASATVEVSQPTWDHSQSVALGTEDLAYIMFTSGSTGTPKAVAMRYGALDNLLRWQLSDERLGQPARTLQLTPLSFDVSFQEIFGCLAAGGTLAMVDDAVRRDPVRLLQTIVDLRIERLYLPFVGLQQLAEVARVRRTWPSSLRDVVTAGEQLQSTPALRRLFNELPDCRLHNHYGPCETHVVTTHTLPADTETWADLPPIGKAVANVEVMVVDDEMMSVETGEPGEMILGGACLARGYLDDPIRTSEKFIDLPTGRFYRTGDIGRVNSAGEFEWIGRNDHQTKIRGHRVELGEVETVLAAHPGVQQAVVMPHRRDGYNELTAYVLPATGDDRDSTIDQTIEGWRSVWDRTYRDGEEPDDFTLNIAGWKDSYRGAPIPESEMKAWAEAGAERIRAISGNDILEIGSGTGLILFRVAPSCRRYVAMDFSREANDFVRSRLRQLPTLASKVEVLEGTALDVTAFESASFDTIVLNSVTQHFPGIDYLTAVLRQCVRLLRPGGSIFVGDVASFTLRRAFWSSVERTRATGDATAGAMLQAIEHKMRVDPELTIAPVFFAGLPGVLDSPGRVEIHVKRGADDNELNRFRYDVMFTLRQSDTDPAPAVSWTDATCPDINAILENVERGKRVTGVRDARTWHEVEFFNRLQEDPDARLEELHDHSSSSTIDPERLYETAESLGIEIEVRPADPGTFDVGPPGRIPAGTRPEQIASDPLLRRRAESLVPSVRSWLETRLPEHMLPASYVLVGSFPLTTSGKVNRRALPPADRSRPPLAQPYTAARTDAEKLIEEVWRDVLDLDRIGIDDSFFELGGNSISVLSLALKLTSKLDHEIAVIDIFAHPTIRQIAGIVDGAEIAQKTNADFRAARQRNAYINKRGPGNGRGRSR